MDDLDVRAAFTSSALLGAAMAGLVVAGAPLAAHYFRAPPAVPVIRWFAVIFVVTGLGETARALLQRHLRFRGLGLIDVLSYLFGYAVPVLALAASGFGVWSLVVGAIAQATVASGLAFAMTRHPLRPTLLLSAHRRLLGFGTKVSIISFLEFLGSMADTLVVGRLGTSAELGLYNRAFTLANLPMYQLHNGLAKVLFPVLSSGQRDRQEFERALVRVTRLLIRLILPVGIGMAVAAPELVSIALGPKWTAAARIVPAIAIGYAVNLLATPPGIAVEALGALRGKLTVQTLYTALLFGGLVVGTALLGFDLRTVAVIVAITTSLRTVGFYVVAASVGAFSARAGGTYVLEAVVASCVAVVVIGGAVLGARLADWSDLARLGAAVGAGLVVLAALLARDMRSALLERRHDRVGSL